MKITLKGLIVLSIILVFLVGCNKNTEPSQNDKEDTTTSTTPQQQDKNKDEDDESANHNENSAEIEVEPLPTTYQELASKMIGEYADINPVNQDEKILEIFKDLPDISTNPDEKHLDDFYNELLKKVQKEFKGPEEAIRKLKFQSLGNPEIGDSRYQFKENLNVEILLDASGSMGEIINGKAKMAIAKDSILSFAKSLPKGAKISLRVYGHKGSGSDSDKALSCKSSDLVYSTSNFEEGKLKAALNKFSPKGWTPIGLALNEAKKDLANYDGANNTNIVYLVSDGVDTCDIDPINAAKELFSSNISPIINVIGFDVDNAGQNQLKQIANVTQGIYENVNDESGLKKELEKLSDVTQRWNEWKVKGKEQLEIQKIDNSLDIFGYITDENSKASDEKMNIGLILNILQENNKFNKESYTYLERKNNEYHQWIRDEIAKFNDELRALNDKSYTEAIKELENKYKENTQ